MEVATLKIAKTLYLTLHELVHWHESGLLGSTKPVDQLVPYFGEPGNNLEVVPDTLVKVCLHTILQSAFLGHCFVMTLVHLVRPTS